METRVCSDCKKDIPPDMGHAFILEKVFCISCLTEKWKSPNEKPMLARFVHGSAPLPKGEDGGK
jgi:hypothetical protein